MKKYKVVIWDYTYRTYYVEAQDRDEAYEKCAELVPTRTEQDEGTGDYEMEEYDYLPDMESKPVPTGPQPCSCNSCQVMAQM